MPSLLSLTVGLSFAVEVKELGECLLPAKQKGAPIRLLNKQLSDPFNRLMVCKAPLKCKTKALIHA